MNDLTQFNPEDVPEAEELALEAEDQLSLIPDGAADPGEEENPEEDESTLRTLTVPVLDNMDTFLWKHDKAMIVSELNENLMNGTLDRLMDSSLKKKLIRSSDILIVSTEAPSHDLHSYPVPPSEATSTLKDPFAHKGPAGVRG